MGVDKHGERGKSVIAAEQRGDVVPKRGGVDAKLGECGACFVEIGRNALLAERLHVVFGVARYDESDFLVRIDRVAGKHAEEVRNFFLRHLRQGRNREERFLSAEDISADFLAENFGIAVGIEIVVLELEGQTDLSAKR